jgi:predicted ribosomally synthesized peptide with SipW-like signal peptide
MTADRLELSRRKILASAGAIGLAGAGAGLGTSAYFSDAESFTDNSIAAGTLDLKVDWEEHYSYPQIYGFDDPTEGLDVQRSDPEDDDYVGLPDPANPLIWIHQDDLAAFMDNTSIEAYPDTNDDGVQEPFAPEQGGTTEEGVGYICEDGADVPEDLDPTAEGALRTDNADTYDADADEPLPLVNLNDVKPGDFGELTLSFHLCDNPGFVWLQGQPVRAAENGHTEPEAKDDDEVGDADESYDINEGDTVQNILDSDIELLDELQTIWWYDKNGDNVLGGGVQEAGSADIAFLLDRSGSMGQERNFLENEIQNVATQLEASGVDAQFGLVPYEDGTSSDGSGCTTFVATDITDDPTALDFSYSTCGGNEDASEAIQFANANLSWRSGAKKIFVVITDEDDDGTSSQRTDALDLIDNEDACLLAVSPDADGPSQLKTMASQVECGEWVRITEGLSQGNITALVEFVGDVVGTEPVFFTGSLRESLALLSQDKGFLLDGDLDDEGIQPFQASNTNYIGFAWWLPTETGNEVQSDSVGFDLGFYTEQARNNDPTRGEGAEPPENPEGA